MAQRFYADKTKPHAFPNGAIGFGYDGPNDCLGPYAVVRNCPIAGTMGPDGQPIRLTCYAQNYADTYFSIPAATRYKGKHIRGFFTNDERGCLFHPMDSSKHLLPMAETEIAALEARLAKLKGE